jgi:phage repressor protein C with HTH and peptisase S24 domain
VERGNFVDVPRLSLEASAGSGAVGGAAAAREIPFDAFRFSRRWLREQGLDAGHVSAIRVLGDSMEPVLREGDEILVDTRAQPFRDGIHVVRLDDALLVKRVASQGGGRFSLLSQNLAYPPVSVGAGEFAVIGRVVWKGGRL